jgi:hypothetical protein
MKLQEKFSLINCNDCDIPYCEIKCTILKPSELNHLEKIADEFAIDFAEWYLSLWLRDDDSSFDNYSPKELLEIYKKEKGL